MGIGQSAILHHSVAPMGFQAVKHLKSLGPWDF
jgi:hypothetical protein